MDMTLVPTQHPRAKRKESPGGGRTTSGETLRAATQPVCVGKVPGATAEALQGDPEAGKSPSEMHSPSSLGAGCRCPRLTFADRMAFFDQPLKYLQTFLPP